MMCRHQNNTIFLMGLGPDYCAHCEVGRLRALNAELLAACQGALKIAKEDETDGLGWKAIEAMENAVANATSPAA